MARERRRLSRILVLRTANECAVVRLDFVNLAALKLHRDFCRPVLASALSVHLETGKIVAVVTTDCLGVMIGVDLEDGWRQT